jgi:nucleotide-binding universal stress UspA family protein
MKMLIALDPFGHSHKALDEAVRLAKLQAAELIIVAIAETFQDTEHSYVGLEGGGEALVPLAEKKAEDVRNAVLQEGVAPKIIVQKGTAPAAGILKCAEEEKADLIVMGHRERKGLDLFILGSVATKVVTNARCSVLVVR